MRTVEGRSIPINEGTPTRGLLVFVGAHPGEHFPEQLRESQLQTPMADEVYVVDAFPEAAREGNRNLGNSGPYGNLNVNYGDTPSWLLTPMTPDQARVADCTRARAAYNMRLARHFTNAVDVHGMDNRGESTPIVNRRPTLAALGFICGLGFNRVVISDSVTLTSVVDQAMSLDIADNDPERSLERVRAALEDFAVGRSPVKVRPLDWFELIPTGLTYNTARRLGLLGRQFGPFEELPSYVAEYLGYEGSVHIMTCNPSPETTGFVGEIVVKSAPPEGYDNHTLASVTRVGSNAYA